MEFKPDGLTLLRHRAEWIDYCDEFARHKGWGLEIVIGWGDGPAQYPALVSTYASATCRVVSCYVYVSNAMELLEAASGLAASDKPAGLVGMSGPSPFATAPAANVATTLPVDPTVEFYRMVQANQLTLVQTLIDHGAITKERYEAKLASNLAVVDRWNAESKERRQIRDVVTGVDAVLGNHD